MQKKDLLSFRIFFSDNLLHIVDVVESFIQNFRQNVCKNWKIVKNNLTSTIFTGAAGAAGAAGASEAA